LAIVIPSCPECGAPGVPLLFGLPIAEANDAAADGQLALGGCVLSFPMPNWQCPEGHQWEHDDKELWNDHLLTVLKAHGYRG
jgi:hypothetical protein